MIAIFAIWAFIVVRGIMNAKDSDAFVVTVSQEEVESFARAQLADIQRKSFANNQELCAIVFENSEGDLGVTPLVSGEKASCDIIYFDEPGMAPVASFHTHGAFDLSYDSEVPSMLDMRSDIESGMDGYVSTPGGRFWRIDARAGIAELVCGEGCLPQDRAYKKCDADVIENSYSIEQLHSRRQAPSRYC